MALTKEALAKTVAVFKDWDKKGSGQIEKSRLVALLQKLDPGVYDDATLDALIMHDSSEFKHEYDYEVFLSSLWGFKLAEHEPDQEPTIVGGDVPPPGAIISETVRVASQIFHARVVAEAAAKVSSEADLTVDMWMEQLKAKNNSLQPLVAVLDKDEKSGPLVELEESPSSQQWPLNVLASEITVMGWLVCREHQGDGFSTRQIICAADCGTGLGDFSVFCQFNRLAISLDGNRVPNDVMSSEDAHVLHFQQRGLTDGNWHHFVVRYDSGAKVAELLVDGYMAERHHLDVACPARLTTISVGQVRDAAHGVIEQTGFQPGQLRLFTLHDRLLSFDVVKQAAAARPHCVVPAAIGDTADWADHSEPPRETCDLLLIQLMSMGIGESKARAALQASLWTSVEAAMGHLFGAY